MDTDRHKETDIASRPHVQTVQTSLKPPCTKVHWFLATQQLRAERPMQNVDGNSTATSQAKPSRQNVAETSLILLPLADFVHLASGDNA